MKTQIKAASRTAAPLRFALGASALLLLSGCASGPVLTAELPIASAAPEAEFLIGRYADLRGASSDAAASFLSAARNDPGNPVLALSALRAALEAGDNTRALEAARLTDALDLTSPEAALTLAVDALSRGKYAIAEAYLGDVHGSPLTRSARDGLLAWTLAARGKTEPAVALLRADPDGPLAPLMTLQAAMVLDRAGLNQRALDAYEAAEANGLNAMTGRVLKARLLQRMGRKEDALKLLTPTDGVDSAIDAAERRRINEGGRVERLDTASEGAAIGLMTLGSLIAGQAPAELATPYLTLALKLDPSLDAARLIFADALQSDDESRLKSAPAALLMLDAVPATSDYATLALVQKAYLLRALDRDEEALATARDAAERAKGATTERALADLYRSLERYREAEAIYDEIIKASAKEDWRLLFARGAMRERLQRWPEAEADLKRALALAPKQPEVMNYLAYAWVERGENVPQALAMLEEAVALSPDSGHIVDSLGWAHFKRGDFDLALVHLERAVELEPDNAEVNEHLGDLYWRLGRKREAGFQWTRALSLKPTPEQLVRLQDKQKTGLPPLPTPTPLARSR